MLQLSLLLLLVSKGSGRSANWLHSTQNCGVDQRERISSGELTAQFHPARGDHLMWSQGNSHCPSYWLYSGEFTAQLCCEAVRTWTPKSTCTVGHSLCSLLGNYSMYCTVFLTIYCGSTTANHNMCIKPVYVRLQHSTTSYTWKLGKQVGHTPLICSRLRRFPCSAAYSVRPDNTWVLALNSFVIFLKSALPRSVN